MLIALTVEDKGWKRFMKLTFYWAVPLTVMLTEFLFSRRAKE